MYGQYESLPFTQTGKVEWKIAVPHPGWRVLRVDADGWAEHNIGLRMRYRRDKLDKPVLRRMFVVIYKCQKIAGGMVETRIASNRYVGGRAMHVDDVVRDHCARTFHQRLCTRSTVIIGDDDAYPCSCRHGKRCDRQQRPLEGRTAIGTNANIDLQGGGFCHGDRRFLKEVSSSIQKPVDQAKCITMAANPASGPEGLPRLTAIQKP